MPDMNIAAVLKSEIVRLARKEVRNETQALKKAAKHLDPEATSAVLVSLPQTAGRPAHSA